MICIGDKLKDLSVQYLLAHLKIHFHDVSSWPLSHLPPTGLPAVVRPQGVRAKDGLQVSDAPRGRGPLETLRPGKRPELPVPPLLGPQQRPWHVTSARRLEVGRFMVCTTYQTKEKKHPEFVLLYIYCSGNISNFLSNPEHNYWHLYTRVKKLHISKLIKKDKQLLFSYNFPFLFQGVVFKF